MKAGRFKNGIEEYKHFLLTYVLPIIGISYDNNLINIGPSVNSHNSVIREDNENIIFSTKKMDLFSLKHKSGLSEDAIRLARNIIPAFFQLSKYSMQGEFKTVKMRYPTDEVHEENLKSAVQKGICDWCIGYESTAFYELISVLEQWSVQTYEGNIWLCY